MPGCHGEVEGEIFLRGQADSIHLPAGRLSNLVFKFRTSSLFGQTARTTSYAMLIRPREGYTYEAAVPYNDGLFSIDIVEIARNARRAAGCRDWILPRARLIENGVHLPEPVSRVTLRPKGGMPLKVWLRDAIAPACAPG